MSNSLRPAALFVLLGSLAPAVPAAAIDGLEVHGFAAQGYVLSDGNNVNGESADDGGSLEFRELGLNASYRAHPRLLLSVQAASVHKGEVTEEDLLLDYALADGILLQTSSSRLGLRAGKLKLPFGFYNEARDAVFSRPSILLPQSLYLDNDGARAFGYFSLRGVAAYGSSYVGDHELSFDLGAYGDQRLGDTAEISILRRPASGRFRHDRSAVLRLADDIRGGRWRLALTASASELRYSPGEQPPFTQAGEFRFEQILLSAEHNREHFSLTAEIVRRRIELDDLIPGEASSATEQDSLGYYLQGTWRITPTWSLVGRYDERQRELQDRGGHRQARETGLPRHYFFARDWSLTSRHQLTPAFGLWLEAHLIDGVAWVNPLDNPRFLQGAAERHWSLLSVMAAWRF